MSVVWESVVNDNKYFQQALAEWLRAHPLCRGRITFDSLDTREQSKVLARAQELKWEAGR